MIQDIAPLKLNNHYEELDPRENDFVIFTEDNKILLKETSGEITFPTVSMIPKCEYTFLFSVDDIRFFLSSSRVTKELFDAGYAFSGVFNIRRFSPKWLCFAGVCALQLSGWYNDNKFCGRCGHTLEKDHVERMMHCPNCGNAIYPKISPAVIVAIVNGDKILMSKYSAGNFDHYALIAGFTEFGETIEETVQREVMEEVGLKVKNIKYYKTQPWPFTSSLLMGFFCELDGSDEITLDRNELKEAVWVKREDMDIKDDSISLTYEMMTRFQTGEE